MSKWPMVRINDALSQKITGEWGAEPSGDNDVKVLGTRSFNNDGRISYDLYSLRSIPLKKINGKKLTSGDIILEKSGGSDNQPVGRVVYFDLSDEDLYLCNNFTQVLRPAANVFSRYLFFALYYLHLKGRTLPCQNKTTGIRNLNINAYLGIEIPLPPLEEQKRIAAMLDKAQSLIDLRKKQVTEMDALVKAKFIEMFGSGLDGSAVDLKDICSIITDGTHQPPKFTDSGIPFLFVSNIVGNEICYQTEKYITRRDYDVLIKRTPIELGDILLTTVGSYGNPAIVRSKQEFCFQRHIAYVKPKQNIVNSVYLHAAMLSNTVKSQIEAKVKGLAQKTLNLSELKTIKVNIPTLHIQNRFADFTQQVDKLRSAKQKALEQMETLYNALMQQAFN